MSEIRIDPITGRQVIFARERDLRPSDLWTKEILRQDPPRQEYEPNCPFCKGNEEETPPEICRLPEGKDWQVRIVPNKFPAIGEGDIPVKRVKTHALFEKYSGIGQHDVLIESARHNDSYFTLSPAAFVSIVRLMHQRYSEILRQKEVDFVSFFKNYQRLAGASLYHPHSQIIGLNSRPDFVRYEVEGAQAYHSKSSKCPYCDILAVECSKKERLVYQNEYFVAICPYAPKYKYEVWILPKNHRAFFEQEQELDSLAEIFYHVFRQMYRVLGDFPFNLYLHALPKSMKQGQDYYHYHFEITPRLSGNAGFELGTGIYINSVFPEQAAAKLREG